MPGLSEWYSVLDMALTDLQANISDELSRSDLSVQIGREITNSILFYQNKRFWFNSNSMVTLTTISGQREYVIPSNFASVLTVRSQMSGGGLIYPIKQTTLQDIENQDLIQTYTSNYILLYCLYNGLIRLYPPPIANLPVFIQGTVLLPTLTTTAATKPYAANTSFNKGDTIQDPNGNIQTAQNTGTTQAAPTNTYAANTAFTAGNTVFDGFGNTQTCLTPGTSGLVLAVQPAGWGRIVGSITVDGNTGLTWQVTKTQWNTNFQSVTSDGGVAWLLTSVLNNAWTSNAEELIRTRTIRQLYARYIGDQVKAQVYAAMEKENVKNLYEKNIGQGVTGQLVAHF